MPTQPAPRALLVDLDDTILDNESTITIPECWRLACADVTGGRADLDAARLGEAIKRVGDSYWSDPERARVGWRDYRRTGIRNVHSALLTLGHDDADLACAIYDNYRERRQAAVKPFPGAIEALAALRDRSIRLALITNGSGSTQRAKIDRFDLARHFGCILIESEFGVGKPDERVYRAAMKALDVSPSDTWMVGDNFEWDVAAPQKLGLGTVWVDREGHGVGPDSAVLPDYVISSLQELPELLSKASTTYRPSVGHSDSGGTGSLGRTLL